MNMCYYGCGQEGKYLFKNANKWCCSDNFSSCPEMRRKKSERIKSLGDKHPSKRPEVRKKISEKMKGENNPSKRPEVREKISEGMEGKNVGEKGGNYKGGYDFIIPLYDTYAHQLEPYGQECRRNLEDPNILEVKCTWCKKWYKPTRIDISNRLAGINSDRDGGRLYCSDSCKDLCPIFGKTAKQLQKQVDIAAGQILEEIKREQDELKQEVIDWVHERDHDCQICGSDQILHVHHIDPRRSNPIFINDLDSLILLCKKCHIFIHTHIPGCTYTELRNLKCPWDDIKHDENYTYVEPEKETN